MKNTPTSESAETTAYTLREIPRSLWQKARIRAIQEDKGMRDVLLGLLRSYVAGKAALKDE
jgi:hypothetical protein